MSRAAGGRSAACSAAAARFLAAVLFAGSLLPACSAPGSADSRPLEFPPAPERPRDPWVLRCVLDEQPRMLVVALSGDLWLAYDTTTCTLASAWRGDVDFDGPVYTTAHGPQPTSRGEDLHDPLAGSVWLLEPGSPAVVQFRGYTLREGRVTLNWELPAAPREGRPPLPPLARIEETPEVTRDAGGRLALVRRFEVFTQLGQSLLLRATAGPDAVLRPAMRCSGSVEWQLAWGAGETPRDVGLELTRGTGMLEVLYAQEDTP